MPKLLQRIVALVLVFMLGIEPLLASPIANPAGSPRIHSAHPLFQEQALVGASRLSGLQVILKKTSNLLQAFRLPGEVIPRPHPAGYGMRQITFPGLSSAEQEWRLARSIPDKKKKRLSRTQLRERGLLLKEALADPNNKPAELLYQRLPWMREKLDGLLGMYENPKELIPMGGKKLSWEMIEVPADVPFEMDGIRVDGFKTIEDGRMTFYIHEKDIYGLVHDPMEFGVLPRDETLPPEYHHPIATFSEAAFGGEIVELPMVKNKPTTNRSVPITRRVRRTLFNLSREQRDSIYEGWWSAFQRIQNRYSGPHAWAHELRVFDENFLMAINQIISKWSAKQTSVGSAGDQTFDTHETKSWLSTLPPADMAVIDRYNPNLIELRRWNAIQEAATRNLLISIKRPHRPRVLAWKGQNRFDRLTQESPRRMAQFEGTVWIQAEDHLLRVGQTSPGDFRIGLFNRDHSPNSKVSPERIKVDDIVSVGRVNFGGSAVKDLKGKHFWIRITKNPTNGYDILVKNESESGYIDVLWVEPPVTGQGSTAPSWFLPWLIPAAALAGSLLEKLFAMPAQGMEGPALSAAGFALNAGITVPQLILGISVLLVPPLLMALKSSESPGAHSDPQAILNETIENLNRPNVASDDLEKAVLAYHEVLDRIKEVPVEEQLSTELLTLRNLGSALYQLNRSEEALVFLQEAEAKGKDVEVRIDIRFYIWSTLAAVFFDLNKDDEALKISTKIQDVAKNIFSSRPRRPEGEGLAIPKSDWNMIGHKGSKFRLLKQLIQTQLADLKTMHGIIGADHRKAEASVEQQRLEEQIVQRYRTLIGEDSLGISLQTRLQHPLPAQFFQDYQGILDRSALLLKLIPASGLSDKALSSLVHATSANGQRPLPFIENVIQLLEAVGSTDEQVRAVAHLVEVTPAEEVSDAVLSKRIEDTLTATEVELSISIKSSSKLRKKVGDQVTVRVPRTPSGLVNAETVRRALVKDLLARSDVNVRDYLFDARGSARFRFMVDGHDTSRAGENQNVPQTAQFALVPPADGFVGPALLLALSLAAVAGLVVAWLHGVHGPHMETAVLAGGLLPFRPRRFAKTSEPRIVRVMDPIEEHDAIVDQIRQRSLELGGAKILVLNWDSHEDRGYQVGKKPTPGTWGRYIEHEGLGRTIWLRSYFDDEQVTRTLSNWNTPQNRATVLQVIREQAGDFQEIWLTIDADAFSLRSMVGESDHDLTFTQSVHNIFNMTDVEMDQELAAMKAFLDENHIRIARVVPAISRTFLNMPENEIDEFIHRLQVKIRQTFLGPTDPQISAHDVSVQYVLKVLGKVVNKFPQFFATVYWSDMEEALLRILQHLGNQPLEHRSLQGHVPERQSEARGLIEMVNLRAGDENVALGWRDAAGININREIIHDLAVLIWVLGPKGSPNTKALEIESVEEVLTLDTELHELVEWVLDRYHPEAAPGENHLIAQYVDDLGHTNQYEGALQDLDPQLKSQAEQLFFKLPFDHPVRRIAELNPLGRKAQIKALRELYPEAPRIVEDAHYDWKKVTLFILAAIVTAGPLWALTPQGAFTPMSWQAVLAPSLAVVAGYLTFGMAMAVNGNGRGRGRPKGKGAEKEKEGAFIDFLVKSLNHNNDRNRPVANALIQKYKASAAIRAGQPVEMASRTLKNQYAWDSELYLERQEIPPAGIRVRNEFRDLVGRDKGLVDQRQQFLKFLASFGSGVRRLIKERFALPLDEEESSIPPELQFRQNKASTSALDAILIQFEKWPPRDIAPSIEPSPVGVDPLASPVNTQRYHLGRPLQLAPDVPQWASPNPQELKKRIFAARLTLVELGQALGVSGDALSEALKQGGGRYSTTPELLQRLQLKVLELETIRIRERREAGWLSTYEMAAAMKIPVEDYEQIESGHIRLSSAMLEDLHRLIQKLWGPKLGDRRKAAGLTRPELANQAQEDKTYIYFIERNERPASMPMIRKLNENIGILLEQRRETNSLPLNRIAQTGNIPIRQLERIEKGQSFDDTAILAQYARRLRKMQGTLLREKRLLAGMKQALLGRLVELGQTAVSDIEIGKFRVDLPTLRRLHRELNKARAKEYMGPPKMEAIMMTGAAAMTPLGFALATTALAYYHRHDLRRLWHRVRDPRRTVLAAA